MLLGFALVSFYGTTLLGLVDWFVTVSMGVICKIVTLVMVRHCEYLK